MAKTITITLSNADLRALEHDLLDPGQWIQDAVVGKIASCTKRMASEAARVLSDDPSVESVPSAPDKLIAALAKHPHYRTRKQRDDDERAAEQARQAEAEAAIKEQAKRDEEARKAMEQAMKEAAEAGEKKRKADAEEAERRMQERIDQAVAKALKDAKAGKP